MIEILLLLTTFLLFVNHAFIMFVTSDAFVIALIIILLVTIATSIIHSKLDYCNSLLLKLHVIKVNHTIFLFPYFPKS